MVKRRRSKTHRRNKKRLRPSRRLSHETLEDRHLLTTWTVTTLVDTIDASDGQVSLREAVDAARMDFAVGNAVAGSSGDDIIQFAPSLFASGSATITLTDPLDLDGTNYVSAGSRDIIADNDGTDRNSGSLTVAGPGRDLLAISGENLTSAQSIFTVEDTVTIKGLELKNSGGRAIKTRIKPIRPDSISPTQNQVQESYVRIEDSRITGNELGGIAHLNGTLEVVGTIIEGNTTPDSRRAG